MDQSLKERLVGAAVLVVLAVIFVPMVLDGPDPAPAAAPTTVAAVPSGASTFRYDLNAPLPEQGAAPATAAPAVAPATAPPAAASQTKNPDAKPPEASVATVVPKPAAAPATKAPTSAAPKPVAPEPKAVAPAAPKPAPKPAPSTSGGWAAQVGSFSTQATADRLAADLKGKGFKAFVMPHKDGKTTLYRVRVGPVATREAAVALADKIGKKSGETARPVPHP
jgi:DedD protein